MTARRVLIDSGPLLALFNGSDRWHPIVVAWLHSNPQTKLFTTWPVTTEVCALLARRIGNPAALDFLNWVQRGGVKMDPPQADSLGEVLHICQRFADLPLDLADASIAEAAARLRIRDILSIDSDFHVYRDRQGRALNHLLRPHGT